MFVKNKNKRFAQYYYSSLNDVYNIITSQIEESNELKFLIDSQAFHNELLFMLLFFSTVRIPTIISDKKSSIAYNHFINKSEGIC